MPRAGVGHRQPCVAARRHVGGARRRAIELDVRVSSMVRTPPCGIASRALIDEIENDLLELSRVRHAPGRSCSGTRTSTSHVLADAGAAASARCRPASPTRLTTRGCENLAAAEGQQLPGQRRRALGGARRSARPRPAARCPADFLSSSSLLTCTMVEQVVEVVRDAAGELTDRLHLLRLPILLLERIEPDFGGVLLGKVAKNAGELVAAGRDQFAEGRFERDFPAVLVPAGQGCSLPGGRTIACREVVPEPLPVRLPQVGGNQHGQVLAEQLPGGVAEDSFGRRVREPDPAAPVDRDDRVGGGLDDVAILLPALVDLGDGRLALVQRRRRDQRRQAGHREERRGLEDRGRFDGGGDRERSVAERGVPHREPGDDQRAGRRADRAEAQRRPQQNGKQEIRTGMDPPRMDRPERDPGRSRHENQHDQCFDPLPGAEGRTRSRRLDPGQDHGSDDQHPETVAGPPHEPGADRRHAETLEHGAADQRRNRVADTDDANRQYANGPQGGEADGRTEKPLHHQAGHDRFEAVGQRRRHRQLNGVAGEQVRGNAARQTADDDGKPVPVRGHSQQAEHQPAWRPHHDHAPADGQRVPDPGACEISEADENDTEQHGSSDPGHAR